MNSRTLVVWCPTGRLPRSAPMDAPAAVGQAGGITACTAAARASGVKRGQKLRDAQRHCPGLAVHAEEPQVQRGLEQVASVVESFCPRVEVVRPGLCAVPARGPARYFGGEQALADLVREAVTARGFEWRGGIADGVFGALQLAARVQPAGTVVSPGRRPGSSPRPPSALSVVRVIPDELEPVGLLHRLGIRTLVEFAALPAGDVLTRFGVDATVAPGWPAGANHGPRPPGHRGRTWLR